MAPAREFVILLAFALVLMSSLLNHHQFLARFHMGHSVEGLLKICSISSAPHMVKIHKNLLQNQESFDDEFWYIASVTRGLPSLFK